MKNVILACGLCAFSLAAFGCDSAEKQGKEAFEGFYAGAGLCYMHTINKGALLADNAEDDFYNAEIKRVKAGKIGGSLVAGYGLFATGNFYFGGELMLDVTGNKTANSAYSLNGNVYSTCCTKVRGFVPTLAMRFGGYCNSIDTLFFGRVGLASVRSEFEETGGDLVPNKVKVSKLAPGFGIGVEKRIACVNLRFEGDYRFQADKECLMKDVEDGEIYHVIRNRTKGYTVRVMAVYNF